MTDNETLLAIARTRRCHCGRAKETLRLLCATCFFRLPEHMRLMLDRRGGNTAAAFDAAVRYLDVHYRSLNAFRQKHRSGV